MVRVVATNPPQKMYVIFSIILNFAFTLCSTQNERNMMWTPAVLTSPLRSWLELCQLSCRQYRIMMSVCTVMNSYPISGRKVTADSPRAFGLLCASTLYLNCGSWIRPQRLFSLQAGGTWYTGASSDSVVTTALIHHIIFFSPACD